MANIFPIDFEEKLTMAQDDYILFSDSEDGNKIKKAQYKNLKWEQGNPWQDWQDWAAATITIGTVSTWAAWSSATVVNSWTSTNAVLDFSIPQWIAWTDWDDWAAATITVGNTTTGNPGTNATVTNTWTSSAAVLDFTIPQWATGATWNWIASITSSKSWKITTVTITETNSTVDTFQISDWADGTWSWDVIWPASSVSWDVVVFDWTTWKLIKDGSVALSTLSAWASAWATAVQPWDIWTAAACNTWTSSWNVPILDSNWKLATSTLPWVALTDTFTVSTSSDLTSLSSADQWDIAIVTTENKTYVLSVAPYSTAANWKEILAPTWWVTSVNGSIWAVIVNDVKVSASAPASPIEWMVWYDTTNDVLKTYNWASWDEAWGWGDVRVFAVPSVNDDISDMLTRLSAWKWVILHETVSWTDVFYKVDYHDSTWVIDASLVSDSAARFYTINYSYLDNTVTSKTSSTASFFAPETAGTQWQVLTKTASWYEWQQPSGWEVMVSSQSWNILTSWMSIWAWTQSDYDGLGAYDSNTVYLTI